MGYTHYFNLKKKPTQKKWDSFTKECQVLLKNLPSFSESAGGCYINEHINIFGVSGGGKPEINSNLVCFNGDGSKGLDHETFVIEKAILSDFCKTARKPYDLLAVACLIAANRNLGLLFSSDGYIDYEGVKECSDLIPAMKYYNEQIKPVNAITGDPDPVTEDELWLIRKKYKKYRLF